MRLDANQENGRSEPKEESLTRLRRFHRCAVTAQSNLDHGCVVVESGTKMSELSFVASR